MSLFATLGAGGGSLRPKGSMPPPEPYMPPSGKSDEDVVPDAVPEACTSKAPAVHPDDVAGDDDRAAPASSAPVAKPDAETIRLVMDCMVQSGYQIVGPYGFPVS